MGNVSDYFGCLVFDGRVMKAILSADVYASLRKTIDEGERLNSTVANAVPAAMKDWAVANGATHYTHWFQPLTGITAEKHDSFICYFGKYLRNTIRDRGNDRGFLDDQQGMGRPQCQRPLRAFDCGIKGRCYCI